ncbi:MAG: helix-turn-helix domain-containing protein [Christensenellales bacterium]|jgi:ATP-dependent DNA helicase RecG
MFLLDFGRGSFRYLDDSREEIADKISKTVRTVQRALNSLGDKGYIRQIGSKQNPVWEVLK